MLQSRRLIARSGARDFKAALQGAPHLYVIVALFALFLGALPVMQYFPALLWHLPLWLEYALTSIVWGSILVTFVYFFSLAVALAWSMKHPERIKIVIAGLLLVAAVQTAQWQYSRPVAGQLRSIVTSDGVVLQSSGVSCAAASAANLVRLHGKRGVTEQQMARALGTTDLAGTSSSQIIYGLAKHDSSCRRVFVARLDPRRVKAPAFFFVDHAIAGEEAHAVLYVGGSKGRVEIWDPLVGKRRYTVAKLRRIWHGRAITCSAGVH